MALRALIITGLAAAAAAAADCTSASQATGCTYKFKHASYPSEYGYYEVEGFTGFQPELTMTVGETYIFDQTDATNWMHPLGWAYKPDGAHSCPESDGCPEVEEAGALTYLIDGVEPKTNVTYTYAGGKKTATAVGDGLDGYEPEFFMPKDMWAERKYTVSVVITPEVEKLAAAQGGYIFYFCHIHSMMSGKIKVIGGSTAVSGVVPALYAYTTHAPFDSTCGTTEAAKYENDPQTFLCAGEGTPSAQLASYTKCLHAVDAKMNDEMRILQSATADPAATFMHQMIPHHANAVNMAKTLKKHYASMVEGDEDLDFIVNDIIHRQNHQITAMRTYIAAKLHAKAAGWASVSDVDCDKPQISKSRKLMAATAATSISYMASNAAQAFD